MTHLKSRLGPIALMGFFALAGSAAFGHAALAQSGILGNGIGAATGPVVGTAAPKAPKAPSPPALPGTHTDRAEVAPAGKTVMDMQPTDALFDAINRGDTPAARDAINRGADLNGRNVLGMTPTELSVDLARSDIMFLLLSMRGPGDNGAGAGRPTPGSARMADTNAAKNPPVVSRILATAPKTRGTEKAIPATAPASRQYATVPNNPGVPNPQAGFLGFGTAR